MSSICASDNSRAAVSFRAVSNREVGSPKDRVELSRELSD